MPSGAKRRKAAAAKKKIKEQESPTLTPSGSQETSFNGGDDLKGLESDGGEVSSPATQDPIQHDVPSIDTEKFNEEEELGIVKADVGEDESRVEITRQVKLDEVSGGGGGLSVDVGKNSDGSSSSSSSSSDDEEVRIEKTQVVLDSSEVVEVYESQAAAVVLEELMETADESQVAAVVFEELVESSDDSRLPAVVLEEVVETADDSRVPAAVLEEVVETTDESQEPAVVLEKAVETDDESQVPVVVSEELVFVSENAPVEKGYEDLGKPVLLEFNNELKATNDGALHVTLPTVVSHGETSNVDPFIVKDAEYNVLPSSDYPIAVTRNGVGHHPKSPEIQDSFDNQTPLLQAPLSVQRTSWKGCCGLFEVFTGSK